MQASEPCVGVVDSFGNVLDDFANAAVLHRRALQRTATLRIALAIALAGLFACNIVLLVGVNATQLDPFMGARLSLGLCFVTALAGSIVGVFAAALPVSPLPYLYRLPLAAMAGTVTIHVLLALALGGPRLITEVVLMFG